MHGAAPRQEPNRSRCYVPIVGLSTSCARSSRGRGDCAPSATSLRDAIRSAANSPPGRAASTCGAAGLDAAAFFTRLAGAFLRAPAAGRFAAFFAVFLAVAFFAVFLAVAFFAVAFFAAFFTPRRAVVFFAVFRTALRALFFVARFAVALRAPFFTAFRVLFFATRFAVDFRAPFFAVLRTLFAAARFAGDFLTDFFAVLRAFFAVFRTAFAAPTRLLTAAFDLRATLRAPVAFDFFAGAFFATVERPAAALFGFALVVRRVLFAAPFVALRFALLAPAPWVFRRVAIAVPFLHGGWFSQPPPALAMLFSACHFPGSTRRAPCATPSTRTSRYITELRGDNVKKA